jgi:uncharacterized protein YndB with AHSA1/START domain
MTTEITPIEAADGLGYEVRIEAPREVVWPFFIDPDRIVRWMGSVATLEPRPGGAFRIDYGQGDLVAGQYLQVDEPARVVFTWGWVSSEDVVQPGGSRVEVELEPLDGGSATLLRLRHTGLDTDGRKSHDEGWRYFLPRLIDAAALSGADTDA